jgi:anti-sigma factor ChrR (cupin superfamily)
MKRDDPIFDPVELAALYAAGALPPEEAAAVESRLIAGDPVLAEELASYGVVLAALAEGSEPVAPDPGIRQRLLEKVGGLSSGDERQLPPSDLVRDSGLEILIRRGELGGWRELGIPGVSECVLYHDPLRNIETKLIRAAPGVELPAHPHPGVEECYLLEGDLQTFGTNLHTGDYMRAPPGSHHPPSYTQNGCLLLVWVIRDASESV